MAKERPEARHLVLLPGTLFEANHPQETPELPLAENGDPQDIVLRIRRPALATTITHHNAETGQVQAVDVPWGNTVRLFTPLSTASNNTLSNLGIALQDRKEAEKVPKAKAKESMAKVKGKEKAKENSPKAKAKANMAKAKARAKAKEKANTVENHPEHLLKVL